VWNIDEIWKMQYRSLMSISQGEQGNLVFPIVCKGMTLSFLKGVLFDIMESYTDFAWDATALTDNGDWDVNPSIRRCLSYHAMPAQIHRLIMIPLCLTLPGTTSAEYVIMRQPHVRIHLIMH
jgi:hypothetical protein